MGQLAYLKKFLATLPEMSRQTGYPAARLAVSYGMCYILHGANSEEFRALHLYECVNRRRSEYLLFRDTVRFSDALGAGSTKEDLARFEDKHLFNETFHDFIRRDWLYLPESTPDQAAAFLARNDTYLVKACISTQGKNIFKHRSGDMDAEGLLARYGGRPFVAEGFIRQHPALAALNPTTVNTVRVQTARKGDRVILLGGCLRCGGADAFVDNFHQGGVAYPLDMDSGIVTGPGRTLRGEDRFLRHPSTGCVMPGFQVPRWEELADAVRRAALIVPHVGYVGWDVAVTEEGPELVEGNVNYPDPIVVQLDGRGVRRKLRDLVRQ